MYVKDLRLPQLLSIQLHFPQMTSNPRNRFQRYISFIGKDILISPDHFLSICGRKWDYIWFDKVTENKWIDPTTAQFKPKRFCQNLLRNKLLLVLGCKKCSSRSLEPYTIFWEYWYSISFFYWLPYNKNVPVNFSNLIFCYQKL